MVIWTSSCDVNYAFVKYIYFIFNYHSKVYFKIVFNYRKYKQFHPFYSYFLVKFFVYSDTDNICIFLLFYYYILSCEILLYNFVIFRIKLRNGRTKTKIGNLKLYVIFGQRFFVSFKFLHAKFDSGFQIFACNFFFV